MPHNAMLHLKIFFLFFGHISALVKIENLNKPVCIFFECRTMLCCQFSKYFILFFVAHNATLQNLKYFFFFWPYLGSDEYKRLEIGPNASILNAVLCCKI
ncbi:hypothetical protein PUN28_009745 [Cardiocondyla obscurior]|uniref:Secreted protein n=1 Tax=Cardiocondyla obscurior TaxID=286306 RepID=A0AAW2FNN5_9HYME